MKRVRVIVSGRVQGVSFRARTKKMADSLGLKGWVRNRPDGSVEALFEGSPADVDAAVDWCRKGPSYSIVEHLAHKEEPYKGEFDVFRIVY